MNQNNLAANPNPATSRLYELDWLRVWAIITIFFFHSLRFFTIEDWVVKNPTTYLSIENIGNYLETWMMPLIFVISGASAFFTAQKNKPVRRFIWEKVLRLLVPLLVGIFTISILQVYIERYSHGDFNGSLWDFLPHYFEGFYRSGGNFAWMGLHLWYLEVLFAFNLIFLPVMLALRHGKGQGYLNKLTSYLAAPGVVYLLVLVAIFSWKLINPDGIFGKYIFGWPLGVYFSFFLAGYLFVSNRNLLYSIQRLRWISLAGAVLASMIFFFFTQDHDDVLVWFMILTILGFGSQYLDFSSPFLVYANQAVLPFYILHQPVLIVIGYFVVQLPIPDVPKFFLIAIPALISILGLYEFFIRKNIWMRLLFGMKAQKNSLRSSRIPIASSQLDL